MKKYFITAFIIIVSYFLLTDFNNNIDELRKLDESIMKIENLTQFGNLENARTTINNIKVCNDEHEKFDEEQRYFKEVLEEYGISETDFMDVHNRMSELGYFGFYKYNNYTLYASGGGFGEIDGILITHGTNERPNDFKLNNYNFITIGNEKEKGVYYFFGY